MKTKQRESGDGSCPVPDAPASGSDNGIYAYGPMVGNVIAFKNFCRGRVFSGPNGLG